VKIYILKLFNIGPCNLKILNRTETPPFQVDGMVDASETLRLKYRYLELRRSQVFGSFRKRHHIAACVREYLNRNGFMEVETPFLTKSTPEGARDYLVPSRVNKGLFYALPQSPQLFKQLLMIAGFDRYYQIVRCFRDEDLRADRQPEFTQVDLEMAFSDENDVMGIFEGMMKELFHRILGIDLKTPIPRLEYHDAMERYGTDRPDIRFGMELKDITDLVRASDFKIFKQVAEASGVIKAVNVTKGARVFVARQQGGVSSILQFGHGRSDAGAGGKRRGGARSSGGGGEDRRLIPGPGGRLCMQGPWRRRPSSRKSAWAAPSRTR